MELDSGGGDANGWSCALRCIRTLNCQTHVTSLLVEGLADKRLYVLRRLDVRQMSTQERQEVAAEVRQLGSLRHVFVLSCYGSFEEKSYINLLTDHAENGSLRHLVKASEAETIVQWIIQLALGVEHTHASDLLHYDITLDSIFVNSKGVLKLGDFGLKSVLTRFSESERRMATTPYFTAPEVRVGLPYQAHSDVWAFANVCKELLKHTQTAGEVPQNGVLPATHIMEKDFFEIKRVLDSMASPDPRCRPRVVELLTLDCIQKRANKLPTVLRSELAAYTAKQRAAGGGTANPPTLRPTPSLVTHNPKRVNTQTVPPPGNAISTPAATTLTPSLSPSVPTAPQSTLYHPISGGGGGGGGGGGVMNTSKIDSSFASSTTSSPLVPELRGGGGGGGGGLATPKTPIFADTAHSRKRPATSPPLQPDALSVDEPSSTPNTALTPGRPAPLPPAFVTHPHATPPRVVSPADPDRVRASPALSSPPISPILPTEKRSSSQTIPLSSLAIHEKTEDPHRKDNKVKRENTFLDLRGGNIGGGSTPRGGFASSRVIPPPAPTNPTPQTKPEKEREQPAVYNTGRAAPGSMALHFMGEVPKKMTLQQQRQAKQQERSKSRGLHQEGPPMAATAAPPKAIPSVMRNTSPGPQVRPGGLHTENPQGEDNWMQGAKGKLQQLTKTLAAMPAGAKHPPSPPAAESPRRLDRERLARQKGTLSPTNAQQRRQKQPFASSSPAILMGAEKEELRGREGTKGMTRTNSQGRFNRVRSHSTDQREVGGSPPQATERERGKRGLAAVQIARRDEDLKRKEELQQKRQREQDSLRERNKQLRSKLTNTKSRITKGGPRGDFLKGNQKNGMVFTTLGSSPCADSDEDVHDRPETPRARLSQESKENHAHRANGVARPVRKEVRADPVRRVAPVDDVNEKKERAKESRDEARRAMMKAKRQHMEERKRHPQGSDWNFEVRAPVNAVGVGGMGVGSAAPQPAGEEIYNTVHSPPTPQSAHAQVFDSTSTRHVDPHPLDVSMEAPPVCPILLIPLPSYNDGRYIRCKPRNRL